jgi:beta-mannosidase
MIRYSKCLLLILFTTICWSLRAQPVQILLNKGWQFSRHADNKWYPATVPGTVHTDLLKNKLIPDPYYRDNENKLQWIGKEDWDYKASFVVEKKAQSKKNVELVFDGLDTYADVYLNGQLILSANNMFRQWRVPVKALLKQTNQLQIRFYSAKNKVDSIAKAQLPYVLPDNPRAYARKAQYHYGWDWGPIFITCGIWKNISLQAFDFKPDQQPVTVKRKVELVQEPDSVGRSFYFKIDGKPVYMKGANYIPSDVFLPELKKEDYRKIVKAAKDANMNMLRVWGGGIYEADEFYDLCDEYGIMVWQDFMFAGAMIPDDEAFLENVREEVKYQISRLQKHPCIVAWCGNNEVDEAWNNWGWQTQFNLHGDDSAKVWHAYKRLFIDSLPVWVNNWDAAKRPYVSSSPKNGWGRAKSFTEGDSHYWGVWWGLEDIEVFENKTGRFVSEYGMEGMPNMSTTEKYSLPEDRYLFSDVLKVHQKHPTGYQNIQSYLQRYFVDSSIVKKLTLEEYTYLSQCLQYYCFKNIIAIHRSKYPVNMGTLLWQLNDCWPVCSWSITDYSRAPKAAWYAVKEAYRDDVLVKRDAIRPKDLKLSKPVFIFKAAGKNSFSIESNNDAKYVYLHNKNAVFNISDNYFDLKGGVKKYIMVKDSHFTAKDIDEIKITSLYDILNKTFNDK